MMFGLWLMIALLHPVHETVAEVQWNGESKRLEVALRLDLIDEEWIQKRTRGSKQEPVAKWALPYLRQRFRVAEPPPGKQADPSSYHWVGRQEEGSHVWWYFEIEPRDAVRPTWIEQRVLFDREENYVHRIVILGEVPSRSLSLTAKVPRANFNRSEDESATEPRTDRRSDLDR